MADRCDRLNWFYREVFGFDVDMSDFDKRLLLHKAVYTAKTLELDFPEYKFGWYVRGMYAPDLAVDGYALFDKRYVPKPYTPGEKEMVVAKAVKGLITDKEKAADDFELISSVAYAWSERGMRNDEKIRAFVKAVKPWFSEDRVRDATRRYVIARMAANVN